MTGYQARADGTETTRHVLAAVSLPVIRSGALFPQALVNMTEVGEINDPDSSKYDPEHPLFGYTAIPIAVPSPAAWPDPGTLSGDVRRYHGGLELSGNQKNTFTDAVFFVEGDLSITNGDHTFYGFTTIYVSGKLSISGGTLRFPDGAAIYVNGDVEIQGNTSIIGSTGIEAPWIEFYVGGGLKIAGTARVGDADTPNVVVLLDTTRTFGSHKGVQFTGNSRLHGAIYAPTRVIAANGNRTLVGSLVGKTITVTRAGKTVPTWEQNYRAHEERLRSYRNATGEVIRTGPLRLLTWREVPMQP